MNAILFGANGAMGQRIQALLGDEIAGKVSIDGENGVCRHFQELSLDKADLVMDFSHHSAVLDVLACGRKYACPVVIGTTGHTEAEKQAILEASKTQAVFYAGNVSLGIAVLQKLVKQAVAAFPEADVEIVEIHHNRKVDAPSGTALMLFEAVKSVRPEAVAHCGRQGEARRGPNEVGIQSLRMGNVVGIHEVHICTDNQMLTLRHEAQDRSVLAQGAVRAARFMAGKGPGLYSMEDILRG